MLLLSSALLLSASPVVSQVFLTTITSTQITTQSSTLTQLTGVQSVPPAGAVSFSVAAAPETYTAKTIAAGAITTTTITSSGGWGVLDLYGTSCGFASWVVNATQGQRVTGSFSSDRPVYFYILNQSEWDKWTSQWMYWGMNEEFEIENGFTFTYDRYVDPCLTEPPDSVLAANSLMMINANTTTPYHLDFTFPSDGQYYLILLNPASDMYSTAAANLGKGFELLSQGTTEYTMTSTLPSTSTTASPQGTAIVATTETARVATSFTVWLPLAGVVLAAMAIAAIVLLRSKARKQ